jgi:hypothetical protein
MGEPTRTLRIGDEPGILRSLTRLFPDDPFGFLIVHEVPSGG